MTSPLSQQRATALSHFTHFFLFPCHLKLSAVDFSLNFLNAMEKTWFFKNDCEGSHLEEVMDPDTVARSSVNQI